MAHKNNPVWTARQIPTTLPPMHAPPTIRQLVDSFANNKLSCEAVATAALAAAERADGVFTRINHDVLEQAIHIDRARANSEPLPALAGVPLTLKDLFNVQGQQTLAGTVVLKHEAPVEKTDAVVVGHLRNAGALFLGRANMSEFAFSGMGLNPHYGNPKSIWDRATGRLPGGSSSGGAVSVAEGIVPATIGSDTAGSCRVPAAFNGIVGVKPTYGRISLRGAYPLSPTSDAPGPLANDLDGCFILDHIMMGRLKHGEPLPELPQRAAKSIRLRVPESIVMEGLDAEVTAVFARSLHRLEAAGISIDHGAVPALEGCVEMFRTVAVAVFESWQAHRERLQQRGDEYDPFVRQRMSKGQYINAEAREKAYRKKAELVAAVQQQFGADGAQVDALVYPTVQCIPPAIAEADDAEAMPALNMRCLRNTATVNFFDGCAVSLPCHAAGGAPVGLMLAAGHHADQSLYEIAATVERILQENRT